MTGQLKNLMDRAADLDFAAVDIGAVVEAGDRTVRRRRLALGGGVAAMALVAGSAVVALSGGGDGDRTHVADTPASRGTPLGVVTWTLDGALHTATASYPLGHEVTAYVRTATGYVFADPDGVVYGFRHGEVTRIGRLAPGAVRLVSDNEGDLAGWTEEVDGRTRFVVHDLRTGERTTFGETRSGMGAQADDGDPTFFYALDGRTAYVRDTRGAVAVDVDSGEVRVIDAAARNGFSIAGVEDGQIAFVGDDGDLGVGPSASQTRTVVSMVANTAVFSPDGRYVSLDADEPQVYEVATGRRVPIDIDDRFFGAGYEWLDATTVVLIASRTEEGPAELLTCVVPQGTCTQVVADLGTFAELEGHAAFPNGIPAA